MSDITKLLNAVDRGDARASSELLPLVYGELRRLATHQMRSERRDHTLQATVLVHEAFLRLVRPRTGSDGGAIRWGGRRAFFAAAAEAMRRILIDHARAKGAEKRGGGTRRVSLDVMVQVDRAPESILDLDDALERFRGEEPEIAELVKLRYFCGLTLPQTAEMLGISRATASRHWAYARAWLCAAMAEPPAAGRSDVPPSIPSAFDPETTGAYEGG